MAIWTLFGTNKRISRASRFEREDNITVYGHIKMNFLQAPLEQGEHTLRVITFGGDVTLQLPDHVGVEIDGVLGYSEVKIETLSTGKEENTDVRWTSENFDQAHVRVRIQVLGLFGKIDILRVPNVTQDVPAPLLIDTTFSVGSSPSYEGETARLNRDS